MYTLQSKFTIERYVTGGGVVPFNKWFGGINDAKAQARIRQRLDRVIEGLFGDCKSVGGSVWELRVDYGPGYRIYYSVIGRSTVLLLCGGDKRKQNADIERAIDYLNDYKRRKP